MAINKFVSLDIPLQDLAFEIGLDHDRYRPAFIRWAKKAYGYMHDCGAAVKQYPVHITVEGCSAKLPDNATAVEIVVMSEVECDCGTLGAYKKGRTDVMPQRVYTGANNSTEPCNRMDYEFRIENDAMIFNKSFDGQVITVLYWGYATDCDGKLMVNHLAVDAIVAYIEFMLSKQTRWKNKEFRLPERTIEGNEYRWRRKLAEARGNMIQNTMEGEREMADIISNSGIGENYIYPYGVMMTF